MDSTYLSLLLFLILTIIYYFRKPRLSVADLDDPSGIASKTKETYVYLIIYVVAIILIQFGINISIITGKCGGSVNENAAAAALMTFIPWIFIFGSVVLILIAFPGFKSAFSNVIGYFAVSGSASDILNTLLVNTNVQEELNNPNIPADQKLALQKSAEAIVKLCGDASLMVNQIVPENFKDYWGILKPLMKPEFQGSPESEALVGYKEKLLNLVTTRDNIGEAMWYIYTAVLLISIVQYNLTTRGCQMSPATMAANHQKFLDDEQNKLKQAEVTQDMIVAG
jgi:hypothetical protein